MNFQTQGFEDLELSTQILIREALDRNIKMEILDRKENFIKLSKGNNTQYLKQATKTSLDSYITFLIMENKFVTKEILSNNNITVPTGVIYYTAEKAIEDFNKYEALDIVVKPNNTNFGKGVAIIKNEQLKNNNIFVDSVKKAFEYDNTIIIEEYIEGREFRFLVIGDEVPAILHRIPANVTGDELHTIAELIEIKNRDPLRGKGYKTPLEKLTAGNTEKLFLSESNLDFSYIPKNDEQVFLRRNSNISTGGDSIDYTDDIIIGYKKIAIKAAQAVEAKICGADIIIKDITAEPVKDNYSIIELNFNPALHIHKFPYKGKNRNVEKKVLNLLGY